MAPTTSIIVDGDNIDWTSKEEIEKYKVEEVARVGEEYDLWSDKDTCVPLRYVEGIEAFPATAPLDHPHIMDCEDFKTKTVTVKLRMCDVIATELHN